MTAKKSAKKATKTSARSSKSGKFVSEEFAKKHPATTQQEKRKLKAKKDVTKTENDKSSIVVAQTDAGVKNEVVARPGSDPMQSAHFHALHVEAVSAVENENKEVVAEIEPKPSVLDVARRAWSEVRGADDPEFDACVPAHRERFLFLAEGILKGGQPLAGETMAAKFEQKVSELMKKPA